MEYWGANAATKLSAVRGGAMFGRPRAMRDLWFHEKLRSHGVGRSRALIPGLATVELDPCRLVTD